MLADIIICTLMDSLGLITIMLCGLVQQEHNLRKRPALEIGNWWWFPMMAVLMWEVLLVSTSSPISHVNIELPVILIGGPLAFLYGLRKT